MGSASISIIVGYIKLKCLYGDSLNVANSLIANTTG